MSKGNEFEFQGGAATKAEGEHGNDGGKNRDHARDGRAMAQKSLDFLGLSDFEQAQAMSRHLEVPNALHLRGRNL